MLVDGLRPLWLPAITGVDGNPVSRLSEWVGSGQYYFDGPVGPTTASFVLTPGSTLLRHLLALRGQRYPNPPLGSLSKLTMLHFMQRTAFCDLLAYRRQTLRHATANKLMQLQLP
jgi:hypothetical protein